MLSEKCSGEAKNKFLGGGLYKLLGVKCIEGTNNPESQTIEFFWVFLNQSKQYLRPDISTKFWTFYYTYMWLTQTKKIRKNLSEKLSFLGEKL